MKPWIIAVVAIVSGCVGAAASKLVIPQARAENVQRWEYLCLEGYAAGESMRKRFKAAGAEGWELAAGVGDLGGERWCFKRPLP